MQQPAISDTTRHRARGGEVLVTIQIATDLPDRLAELLALMGWTQEEMGRIGNRRRQAANNWLSGKQEPGEDALRRLALASGGTIEMFREGGPRPRDVVNPPLTPPGVTAGDLAEALIRFSGKAPLTVDLGRVVEAVAALEVVVRDLKAALSEARRDAERAADAVRVAEAGDPHPPPGEEPRESSG